MVYTYEQRTKIVEWYIETKSYVKTQRRFAAHFETRAKPSRRMIQYQVEKFREHGTVQNLNKTRSGRQRTGRSASNINAVRNSVVQSPKKSIRRRSQELTVTRNSIHRILRMDLNLYPYQVQITHKLTDFDMERRMEMGEWFNEMMEGDQEWIKDVWFSDVAHFHLNGIVSKHNYRFWGIKMPADFITQKPLHSSKVTAWCALSYRGIIGPFWFEDEDENAVTINQENYRRVVQTFCTNLCRKRNITFSTQWFQQDGATPHTAKETLEFLRQKFENRLISFKTAHLWAPHSPDLNPLDFFLWGYAKENVYKNNPQTVQELKAEITQFIRRIPNDMCQRVVENFAVRLNACMNRNGGHIEHFIHCRDQC